MTAHSKEVEENIDRMIGKKLRRLRKAKGMTQTQLAEIVGVRFQQIQKYEAGSNRILAARLYELARALHCRVQDFYPVTDGAEPEMNDDLRRLQRFERDVKVAISNLERKLLRA